MADQAKSKIDEATEKAYAEAAAVAVKAEPKVEAPVVAAAEAKKPAKRVATKTAKPAPSRKTAVRKSVARKAAAPKKAVKKAVKKTVTARKAAPKTVAASLPAPAFKTPTLTELKDKIMSKTNTTDFTKSVKEAAADVQSRLKAAYDKGSEFVAEATEFNKANVEALVESGKVLAGAAQERGREAVENTKSAFATVSADAKKLAAVKSPTELFQLQGELARRNFDAMVAYGSQNTEKLIKLANDAFAPISSRMSVAAEKFSKAA